VSVVFFIQHAKRMRRIMLSSVASPAVSIFFHDFRQKNVIEDKICVFLYNFVCKMSQSTKNSARYYKCTQVFM